VFLRRVIFLDVLGFVLVYVAGMLRECAQGLFVFRCVMTVFEGCKIFVFVCVAGVSRGCGEGV